MMRFLVIAILLLATGCTSTPLAKDVFSGTFVGALGNTTQPVPRSDLQAASMRPDFPIANSGVVHDSLYLLLSPAQMQQWSRLSGHRVSVTCTVQQGSLFGARPLFCQPTRIALEP